MGCPRGVPVVSPRSQQEGDDGGAQGGIIPEFPEVAAVLALCPDRHLHEAHQREQGHCGATAVTAVPRGHGHAAAGGDIGNGGREGTGDPRVGRDMGGQGPPGSGGFRQSGVAQGTQRGQETLEGDRGHGGPGDLRGQEGHGAQGGFGWLGWHRGHGAGDMRGQDTWWGAGDIRVQGRGQGRDVDPGEMRDLGGWGWDRGHGERGHRDPRVAHGGGILGCRGPRGLGALGSWG